VTGKSRVQLKKQHEGHEDHEDYKPINLRGLRGLAALKASELRRGLAMAAFNPYGAPGT
jgi:hypothetical protein